MPWGAWCGHDFGLHPYGWGSARQDWTEVEAKLRALRALGVTVVRWFVLASGVNYPCRLAEGERAAGPDGHHPQAIDDYARRVRLPASALGERLSAARRRAARWLGSAPPDEPFEWAWECEPPPLSEPFLDDFVALCRACRAADVRLIPSLLSFEWFRPAEHKGRGVYGGGRRRLVFGADAGEARAAVRAFLDATLVPLLRRSSEAFGTPSAAGSRAHPVFAWESVNEPDWVTRGGPLSLQRPGQLVAASAMNTLLAECRRLVLAAGYDHTIGFKQFSPRWLDPALRAELRRDGPRYYHQGHHYPTAGAGGLLDARLATNRRLPANSGEFSQCLVGEFATGVGRYLTLQNWPWGDPELACSERDGEDYLRARLELIAQRGYSGALLWSAQPGEGDCRNRWDDRTQAQLARFTAHR